MKSYEQTPTPWKMFPDPALLGRYEIWNQLSLVARGLKKANAEFIIRSANSHNALVKAVNMLMDLPLDSTTTKPHDKWRKAMFAGGTAINLSTIELTSTVKTEQTK